MDQTVGSGSDSLVLRINQDAYRGSAQYTIRVDGAQIGGTLTADSLRSSGQLDNITVRGDWAAGSHTVQVNFLNDAYDGTAATDRNLFLDGAAYNGATVGGAARSLLSAGPASFGFSDVGGVSSPAPPSTPSTPPPSSGSTSAVVGSGSDTLVLRTSQDAYQGSAQYTVSVDGRQIGGTLTAQAAHGSGQSDTLTVRGDWAAGGHTVQVNFLNDAYDGTAATDRNLYLDSATYNSAAVGGATRRLLSGGPASFGFTEGGGSTPAPPSGGGGGGGGAQTDRPLFESFDNGRGVLSHGWGSPDLSVRGEVKLTGNSGVMELPSGRSAGHGYGVYTMEARLDGNGPGPALLLWPGDDRWPGQEIDIAEIAVDGSGRHYGTLHWNEGGSDAYNYFIFDGVFGGAFHDYSVRWEPGRITWYVDGAQKATTTSHVPTDYDAGGMNNVVGLMNNSNNTSLTVREVEYSPL
jgi:hypothetical protein